ARSITIAAAVPSSITSIAFKDSAFSPATLAVLPKGGAINLEMRAGDIDAGKPDSVYVALSSAKTDPHGIVVALTQIDNVSGVYRGGVSLGDASDESAGILG